MKKPLAASIFLILLLSLFNGCGKLTDNTSVVSQADSSAASGQAGIPNEIDHAVKEALLENNKNSYRGGECAGEGHIILGTDIIADETRVYTLTMYGEYGFEDGNFVKISGSGIIPAVFTFTGSGEALTCTNITYPDDGSEFEESINRLFPSEFRSRALNPTDQDSEELTSQERLYAQNYLNQIGRKAVIGDYGDFEHVLLTDVGVSVEVSNMTCSSAYADYPLWIGNLEAVENGIRFVYEMRYDNNAHEIIYTKFEYESKTVVEQIRLDSNTGIQVD